MWGKRRKRRTQLSRQLALGLLEDAVARVEQQQEEEAEPEPVPYLGAPYLEAGPAASPDQAGQAGLRPADVPVDNSAEPAAAEDPAPPPRELPARRTTDRTRHGSFG